MPNNIPARLTSLTFDSTDLQRSDLSVHFDIVFDTLDVRGQDTIVPSAAGRTARNRKADVRHIGLRGVIQGTGASEAARLSSWQNLRDEIEALFDPTADPATLAGTGHDSSSRSILARTAPGLVWSDDGVPGLETVTVVLDSVVPDWTVTGGS